MTAPAKTTLVAGTWTKVMDTKKSGIIIIADSRPKFYVYTYVDAGDPVPTDDSTAVQIDETGQLEISHSSDIDVYVKAVGNAGAVIVQV